MDSNSNHKIDKTNRASNLISNDIILSETNSISFLKQSSVPINLSFKLELIKIDYAENDGNWVEHRLILRRGNLGWLGQPQIYVKQEQERGRE